MNDEANAWVSRRKLEKEKYRKRRRDRKVKTVYKKVVTEEVRDTGKRYYTNKRI